MLPELDFLSPLFNPEKALKHKTLVPPNPNAPVFPSLVKAEFLLPFYLQRKRTEWNIREKAANNSIERQLRILWNRQVHQAERTKAKALRRRNLIKETRKLNRELELRGTILECLITSLVKKTPITLRLYPYPPKKMLSVKIVSGFPLLITSRWDFFIETQEGIAFIRSDEIVSVTFTS